MKPNALSLGTSSEMNLPFGLSAFLHNGEYGINFVAYRLHACGFVEPLRLENLIEVYKVNIQSIKVEKQEVDARYVAAVFRP